MTINTILTSVSDHLQQAASLMDEATREPVAYRNRLEQLDQDVLRLCSEVKTLIERMPK